MASSKLADPIITPKGTLTYPINYMTEIFLENFIDAHCDENIKNFKTNSVSSC